MAALRLRRGSLCFSMWPLRGGNHSLHTTGSTLCAPINTAEAKKKKRHSRHPHRVADEVASSWTPCHALERVAHALDEPVDSATVVSPQLLTRWVEAIQTQHPTGSRSSEADHVESSHNDDGRQLPPSMCLAVMQRTLRHRAVRASSIAAGSVYGMHHVLPLDTARQNRPAPRQHSTASSTDTSERSTRLRAETQVTMLVALEKTLIDVVSASVRDFCCAASVRLTDAKRVAPQHDSAHDDHHPWSREDVLTACGTLILYSAASSFPDAPACVRATLKHSVRPALQLVYQQEVSATDEMSLRATQTRTPVARKALGQHCIFVTELLLRVGPSLTSSVPLRQTAHVDTVQRRLHRDVCQHVDAYCDTLYALLDELSRIQKRQRKRLHREDSAAGEACIVEELLWHVHLITSWAARLPVSVRMTPTTATGTRTSYFPMTRAVACALDVVTAVCAVFPNAVASSGHAHAAAHARRMTGQWCPLVAQLAYTTVLHHTLNDVRAACAAHPADRLVQRCVMLLDRLVTHDPALWWSMGEEDADIVWVQWAAALHFASRRACAAFDVFDSNTRACLVSVQSALLQYGLERVMRTATTTTTPATTLTPVAKANAMVPPSRVFVLSFLRAWTRWMPGLLSVAGHLPNRVCQGLALSSSVQNVCPRKTHVPRALLDLLEVVMRYGTVEPTEPTREVGYHHHHNASSPRAGADDGAFPVLARKSDAAVPRHRVDSSPAPSLSLPPDESRVHPPHRSRCTPNFSKRLEDAIVGHWIGSDDRIHCDKEMREDEIELFGYLDALSQLRTHRPLAVTDLATDATPFPQTRQSDGDRHMAATTTARSRVCKAYLPSAECIVRLTHHTMDLVKGLVGALTRQHHWHLGAGHLRHKAPLFLCTCVAFHRAHVDVLPEAGLWCTTPLGDDHVCASGDPQTAHAMYYQAAWFLRDDAMAHRLTALLDGVRPDTAQTLLPLFDRAAQRDLLIACDERGVHTDALVSGLGRGEEENVWAWCVVQCCARLVEPTCAAHLGVSSALIWQHWDHVSSHASCRAQARDHTLLRRAVLAMAESPSMCVDTASTSPPSALWTLTLGRRDIVLDWLLCALAERRHSNSADRWQAGTAARHVELCAEPWLPLRRPAARGTDDSPRAVRCAFTDLQHVWGSLCEAYDHHTHQNGVPSRDTAHLAAVLTSFYQAWEESACSSEQRSALFSAENMDDAEMMTRTGSAAHQRTPPVHDLTLCSFEDDGDAVSKRSVFPPEPDDPHSFSSERSCLDAVSALLMHPQRVVALVYARDVPLTFLLHLLKRCVQVATTRRWVGTAAALDDLCTCLVSLQLVAAVRALQADSVEYRHNDNADVKTNTSTPCTLHDGDGINAQSSESWEPSQWRLTRLDALWRLSQELRDDVCSGSSCACGRGGRTSRALANASPAWWTTHNQTRLHKTWRWPSVVWHTLLVERASIEDVLRILPHVDAETESHTASGSPPLERPFAREVQQIRNALQACSHHFASGT